jgi:replicative DNA helicase
MASPKKSANPLRVPPQALESEKALLGALMLRPEGMVDSVDVLSPDAFYAEKHRLIYAAMLKLWSKSEPIDVESVRANLADSKLLERVGGVPYIAELVSGVPAASNAKHYASQVQKKYMLRSLIDAGEYVAELGFDEAEELEETLDKAEKKIYEVTETPSLSRFASIASRPTKTSSAVCAQAFASSTICSLAFKNRIS